MEPWELPLACACPIGSAGTSCSRQRNDRVQLPPWSLLLSLSSLCCWLGVTWTTFVDIYSASGTRITEHDCQTLLFQRPGYTITTPMVTETRFAGSL